MLSQIFTMRNILNKFVPIRAERKNPRIDSSENTGIGVL
jgi:hypothetical protein